MPIATAQNRGPDQPRPKDRAGDAGWLIAAGESGREAADIVRR